MNKNLPSITLAIPAYNEGESLEWVLNKILEHAPHYLSNYEIIVIDDGSTDNTGSIADQFARKYNFIHVIHQRNSGYGAAVFRGIMEAKKQFVAIFPADGQYLLPDMKRCILLMKNADLVLGIRNTRSDYSLYRLFISYAYLIVLRALFNLRFNDINWLNIWRVSEVKKIHIRTRGIFLHAEIAIRFQRKNLRIVEDICNHRKRRSGQAKNARPLLALKTLKDTLELWFLFLISKG